MVVDGVCCCCCFGGNVEATGEKAECLLLWDSMEFWDAGCGEWSGLLLSASSSQKPPFFHGASVVGEVDGDMEGTSLGSHRLEEVDVDGVFSMVAGAEAERLCVAGMGMSGVRWMEVCRLPSREGGSGLYFCGGASVVGVGVVVGALVVVGLVKGVGCVVGGGWPTA